MLNELDDEMLTRIKELHASTLETLHVKGRATPLGALRSSCSATHQRCQGRCRTRPLRYAPFGWLFTPNRNVPEPMFSFH